jgi:hypothetical protein
MNNWEVGQALKSTDYVTVNIRQVKMLEARFDRLMILLNYDPPLEGYLSVDAIKITAERFAPLIKKSLDPKLSILYARIARAFHCKLVWTEEFYPSVMVNDGIIKTVDIWGPAELTPYVHKAINLIHTMIFRYKVDVSKNFAKKNKAKREFIRRRGFKSSTPTDAVKQARFSYIKYFCPVIKRIEAITLDTPYYSDVTYQILNDRVERNIINLARLDYKLTSMFSGRKYIEDATARKGKFHNHRILGHE